MTRVTALFWFMMMLCCTLASSAVLAFSVVSPAVQGKGSRTARRSTSDSRGGGGSSSSSSSSGPLMSISQGDFEGLDALPYGEESRKYRRTYYREGDWVKHRSNDRFLINLLKTFRSGIVRELSTEIGTVAIIAISVCLYNDIFVNGWEDFVGVSHPPLQETFIWNDEGKTFNFPLAELPTTPFTLSSSALGLLLVFRTNSSFARWTEARKKWSSIQTYSRSLVRLGAGWMKKDLPVEKQRELLEDLANMTWAFARSLQRHLLGSREDGPQYQKDLRQRLKPELTKKLIRSDHKPNRALHELTKAINAFPISDYRHVEMDVAVEHLTEALGYCERIYTSPVPLVYTRHTGRFLGFWILALPLALYPSFSDSWNHLGMVPAAILISFFFFGIDELAIQLEEPFSILPLTEIVKDIELSVDSTVQWYFEDLEEELLSNGAIADSLSHQNGATTTSRYGIVNGESKASALVTRLRAPFVSRNSKL